MFNSSIPEPQKQADSWQTAAVQMVDYISLQNTKTQNEMVTYILSTHLAERTNDPKKIEETAQRIEQERINKQLALNDMFEAIRSMTL